MRKLDLVVIMIVIKKMKRKNFVAIVQDQIVNKLQNQEIIRQNKAINHVKIVMIRQFKEDQLLLKIYKHSKEKRFSLINEMI